MNYNLLMQCATEIVSNLKNVKNVTIDDGHRIDNKPYMIVYFHKKNEKDLNEPRKAKRYKYSEEQKKFIFDTERYSYI